MNDKPSNIVPLPAPTGKTLTPAILQSSTGWLTAWSAAEPLPDGVASQLPALVSSAEAALAPADLKAFAIAMDEITQWVERFGVIALSTDKTDRRKQLADVVRGYDAALADLPADVLLSAVRATIAKHRFRTLPLPGDIREHAETELRERQTRLLRLKTAQMIADREAKARADVAAPRDRTPDQLAQAAAMVAQVSKLEVAPRAMPAERSDLKSEDTDTKAAILRVQAETALRPKIAKPWLRPVLKRASPGSAYSPNWLTKTTYTEAEMADTIIAERPAEEQSSTDMTRDEARALWAASGLAYDALTPESLRRLISLIDVEMKAAGLMNRTYRMRRAWAHPACVSLRCKSYYFDDREAVTFNPDGFVGFAGWADDRHVAPVLAGFARWVRELTAEGQSNA